MSKNELLKEPVLTIVNDFDEWASHSLSSSINWARKNNQKALAVVIDSFGGEAYSLLGMIDILQASQLEIITVVSSKAMSCGAFLLSIGKKRYAPENATIMIHAVRGIKRGDVSTLKNDISETERINNKVFDILDKNTNQPSGFWLQKLKDNNNDDLFLTSQEALKLNLITNIGLPETNEFFEEKEENNLIKPDFTNLKLLVSHHEKLSKNNTHIYKSKEELRPMDLNAVIDKLSIEERKPIDSLKNELALARTEVDSSKKAYEQKELELKTTIEAHSKKLDELNKKSDEDFINSLIQAKKLSQADKADELEILSSLPEAVKIKHKNKLLAKKSIIDDEIPDHGEGDFKTDTNNIKARLDVIAKKYNLDLKNLADLAQAQEYLLD